MTELAVYSTIGVRSAAEELFRKFEKEHACGLNVTWGTAPMLVNSIEGGESADVLVLSRAGIDALAKARKNRARLRRSACGIGRCHRG
jgi:molybdate transport system substrate-binding protein